MKIERGKYDTRNIRFVRISPLYKINILERGGG